MSLHVLNDRSNPVPVRPQPYLSTAAEVSYGSGFSYQERDEDHPFRWMAEQGRLTFAAEERPRFLELWLLSEFHDLSQEVTFEAAAERHPVTLLQGWHRVSVPVAAGADHVQLIASKIFPRAYYPDDERTLSVRVGSPRIHADQERHAHVSGQHANAVLNHRELLAGRSQLRSYPYSLGIDMYGVCNVKPPCVYCEWDLTKEMEGENVEAPFDRETLAEWGEFFDRSSQLVNCSIGEPFMMKNIDELLDLYGDRGKVLEITTNGQILTDRNIEKLLGRNIHLYVSLDAATPETYAQLRNDKFERILHNLRRLVEAKRDRDGLPLLYLVFMPMRCNVHEVEAFVELCADLEPDRLVLRPLQHGEIDLVWDRGGHHFDYQSELLPFAELVRVSGRVAELCRRHGVELSDQMDFGGRMEELFADGFSAGRHEAETEPTDSAPASEPTAESAAEPTTGPAAGEPASDSRPQSEAAARPSLGQERLPACLEPWKSLYILRRGVFPCCYGGPTLAPMDGYREAWNSPLLQGIRAHLAAGRFHEYCLQSPSCPIVRKANEGAALGLEETLYSRLFRTWTRLNAATGGVPRRVLRPLKRVALPIIRRLTEPSARPADPS